MSDFEEGLRALVRAEVKIALALAEQRKADEYLSTATAAKVAEVTPGTIRQWVNAGKLTRHEAGRELRIVRAELDAFLRKGRPRNNDAATHDEIVAKMIG